MVVISHLWTWHLSAFHSVNWVFNLSPSQSTFMSHATPLSLSKNALSIVTLFFASSSQCFQFFSPAARCSKGSHVEILHLQSKQIFVSVTFESVLWLHHTQNSITLFQVLCHRCGIHHGPPSMRLFLSTLDHHPRISLRNKNIVPWDLYALMTYYLALNIGSHHWPLIKRFNWVFDIKSSIHT